MTDTEPSGALLAPAADRSAPAASAETTAGNFGSTRGSGLARGKRPSSAAAPTATPAKSDYKPSAVEIITPAREYKNPFASPEAADVPAPQPAIVETPPAPVAVVAAPQEPVVAQVPMFTPEPVAEKSEIEILPPAESVRPAVSWESHSRPESEGAGQDLPSREERPTFRADRREDAASPAQAEAPGQRTYGREPRRDGRQHRDPREARQPRDPREARQPRDPRDEQPTREIQNGRTGHGTPAAAAARPASGGFIGWLKSLFGAKKPEEVPARRDFAGEQDNRGGDRQRRRRRGGRGHAAQSQGFSGERSPQGGPRPEGYQGGEGDNRGGDPSGGQGRRRHRGGRGRERGGESRSEGRQGGGAI
jgi:hypothetical protein